MDIFDIDLEDHVLRAEIDLVVELMVAAADSPGALGQHRIDEILAAWPGTPGALSLPTAC